jgi:hypothetical protein
MLPVPAEAPVAIEMRAAMAASFGREMFMVEKAVAIEIIATAVPHPAQKQQGNPNPQQEPPRCAKRFPLH